MESLMKRRKFSEINLSDNFFNSLKADYKGFVDWFYRKADEEAFILEEGGCIQAFLYLKLEDGPVTDVHPPLEYNRRLKIGTMKINPHGTRLGERFIKKAFDYAIDQKVEELYVTVFPKHKALIDLYIKYGFELHGKKLTNDGEELVFVKRLNSFRGDILLDYPKVNTKGVKKYILSIYPEYHTVLFPDSILKNETFDVIQDVSHTNSIHKIYVCSMKGVHNLKPSDLVVIYRTSDIKGKAMYRSVVTSICVVEEIKRKSDFRNVNKFIDYCKNYSLFSDEELRKMWNRTPNLFAIKMTYNIAMRKRLIRKKLIEEFGIISDYWGFFELSDAEFQQIIEAGNVDESLIFD